MENKIYNYYIIAVDTAEHTERVYKYMDTMMAYAKFYDVVHSNLWNRVSLVDGHTTEVIEEMDEVPNVF